MGSSCPGMTGQGALTGKLAAAPGRERSPVESNRRLTAPGPGRTRPDAPRDQPVLATGPVPHQLMPGPGTPRPSCAGSPRPAPDG